MLEQKTGLVCGDATHLSQLTAGHPRVAALLLDAAVRFLPAQHHQPIAEPLHRLGYVGLPGGTAQLTVGEHGDAGLSLHRQRIEDCLILQAAQLVQRELSGLVRASRLE